MASPKDQQPPDRRHATRVPTRGLICTHGCVADLSARGMRLVVDRENTPVDGQSQRFTFTNGVDGSEITVQGVVCWTRPDPLSNTLAQVGIVFDEIDTETRDALVRLAMTHGDPGVVSEVTIETTDLYAMLGVPPNAPDELIRGAYHAIIQKFSREALMEPDAQRLLDSVHRAYRILRDPDSRKRYNERFLGRADAA